MTRMLALLLTTLALAVPCTVTAQDTLDEIRLDLNPSMLTNEAKIGDPSGLVDEQRLIIGPPVGKPQQPWQIGSQHNKQYPFSTYLDLGQTRNLSWLWIFDTNGKGDVVIAAGEPGNWQDITTYDCGSYLKWVRIPLEVTTRYLRITRKDPGANFTEIAVYEYAPEAHTKMLAAKAEASRLEAERQASLKKAREEALKRPLVQMAPYGTLSLVDEIDCAGDGTGHDMAQFPADASRVQTILGRPARVIEPVDKNCSYISYRVGQMKLLRPGGVYVLTVEYPEDAPRSMTVINGGNETRRGFHTGVSLGDAMHPKYVNNFVESLDVPLSGQWETWSLLFRLHDRFTDRNLPRGDATRALTPEDGFYVTVCQFDRRNAPLSRGLAVSRIRLFEVIDADKLAQPLRLPPQGLPRRHLFWREEMADGVLGSRDSKPDQIGVTNRIDWWRYKAELMKFLGMHTYSKDLLEFGACQHWDPTPLGGNQWVFHDHVMKHLWGEIVTMMGQEYGFDILPYYEYSGSKGSKGLGNQRRARPLTRDDAYTHIKWIENANADVTDPDTIEDFNKMVDLTVLQYRQKANFVGVWIRPRSQMPVSFSESALQRFSDDTAAARRVTRDMLKKDAKLYEDYLRWWEGKRQQFFVAVRDHMRSSGIPDATVLFTGAPGEPGIGFAGWDFPMVTDRPDLWSPILQQKEHLGREDKVVPTITPQEVAQRGLYLDGLTSTGLDWGGWEVRHARPADDPARYKNVEGILMSHCFNRLFTVLSPRTFDLYRAPAGLALVRHYTLNENMMYDADDKQILGYFVSDVERAGPYCMMAEVEAMAKGDPTMIGYLAGNNFGRGFPTFVRDFNAAFLALPALPSEVVGDASGDADITVRRIRTDGKGTWYAVAHTGWTAKQGATIKLPAGLKDAVTMEPVPAAGGAYKVDLRPCQLLAWWSPN